MSRGHLRIPGRYKVPIRLEELEPRLPPAVVATAPPAVAQPPATTNNSAGTPTGTTGTTTTLPAGTLTSPAVIDTLFAMQNPVQSAPGATLPVQAGQQLVTGASPVPFAPATPEQVQQAANLLATRLAQQPVPQPAFRFRTPTELSGGAGEQLGIAEKLNDEYFRQLLPQVSPLQRVDAGQQTESTPAVASESAPASTDRSMPAVEAPADETAGPLPFDPQ